MEEGERKICDKNEEGEKRHVFKSQSLVEIRAVRKEMQKDSFPSIMPFPQNSLLDGACLPQSSRIINT